MPYLDGAIVKTVARHRTPMARHDGVCNHIAVSNGASLFNYFNQPGNPTSHFYVRKGSSKPGAAMADFEQYVDTRFEAPANLEGNHRLISIETQGGVGDDLDAGWNQPQLERLAWILAQCHQLHGVPLLAMPNSLPTTRGLGYHRLGIDPWRVDGGELWSKSFGKVCPGDARIKQQGLIIARARQLIAGGDMALTQEDADLVVATLLKKTFPVGTTSKNVQSCLAEAASANDAFAAIGNLDIPTAGEAAAAVWDHETTSAVDGAPATTVNLLRYAQGDARKAATVTVDTDALAAAIVAKLPAEQPIDQATVEAGVRAVLGTLDE